MNQQWKETIGKSSDKKHPLVGPATRINSPDQSATETNQVKGVYIDLIQVRNSYLPPQKRYIEGFIIVRNTTLVLNIFLLF